MEITANNEISRLALHFLLKDHVTPAPDGKHRLWSVYESLGASKWLVNLFTMFINHLKVLRYLFEWSSRSSQALCRLLLNTLLTLPQRTLFTYVQTLPQEVPTSKSGIPLPRSRLRNFLSQTHSGKSNSIISKILEKHGTTSCGSRSRLVQELTFGGASETEDRCQQRVSEHNAQCGVLNVKAHWVPSPVCTNNNTSRLNYSPYTP